MDDVAPLVINGDKPKGPIITAMVNGLCTIHYKSLLFLFILFILITSDVFLAMVLKKMGGAVDADGHATPYGSCLQGALLVLGYMILNYLIEHNFI